MADNQNTWKRPDPNAKYTITQYLDVVNANNERVVAGGFEKYMLENQFNAEFLGSATMTPTKIMDDMRTAIYEVGVIGQVEEYRDDFTQKQVPAIDRLTLHLSNDYQKEVSISVFDKKTGAQWNDFLAKTLANLEVVKQDQINLINIDAIYQSCLATGNYIIIPELSPERVEALSDDERLKIVEKIYRKAKQVTKSRTKFNLGADPNKLRFVLSDDAALVVLTAKTYKIRDGQAYSDYSSKGLGSSSQYMGDYLGMPIYSSAYLGEDYLKSTDQKYTSNLIRDYKFSKLSGIITMPETTICLKQELMLTTFQSPTSKSHQLIHNSWSMNSAVFPQFAHLNFVILNDKPTKDEINKARSNLYAQFPSLYAEFKTPISEDTKINEVNKANWRGLSTYK